MNNTGKLLGFEDEIVALIAALDVEGKAVALLDGPPGAGKSTLAINGVGALWSKKGGTVVVTKGCEENSNTEYHSLLDSIYDFDPEKSSLSKDIKDLVTSVEKALGSSAGIMKFAFALVEQRKISKANKEKLNQHEQKIIYRIGKQLAKKPLLLIVDNIQWFDRASLRFLQRMISDEFQKSYPLLKNIKFLLVRTNENYQPVVHKEAFRKIISKVNYRREISYVGKEQFPDLLYTLGASPTPSKELSDRIYNFTQGHILLSKEAANQIRKGNLHLFEDSKESKIFFQTIIDRKLIALGELGKKAIETLKVAAKIGNKFNLYELKCALDMPQHIFDQTIESCAKENFFGVQINNSISFTHDYYHSYFSETQHPSREITYEKICSCLAKIRPGEYYLRGRVALKAGFTRRASVYYLQAVLQEVRNGYDWKANHESVKVFILKEDQNTLNLLVKADRYLKAYAFRECHENIYDIDHVSSENLRGEIDYIRASALLATRSEADRSEARSILEKWQHFYKEETELGSRLLSLYIYGLSHTNDKELAINKEEELQIHLSNRIGYDMSSKDYCHVLDRCCGRLRYAPESTLRRYQRAVRHFAPDIGTDTPKLPIEYYRSLSNYAAGLITQTKYEQASEEYLKIEKLFNFYGTKLFPRVDYPSANNILALYRSKKITSEEAVNSQREIVKNRSNKSDPFYGKNALAVYLTFSGAFDEAIEIWEDALCHLESRNGRIEPSMEYLLKSNLTISKHLAGHTDCLEEWQKLRTICKQVAYTFKDLLLKKHDILEDAFSCESITPEEFDEFVINASNSKYEGPHWKHYAKGFRIPAVEFWREY